MRKTFQRFGCTCAFALLAIFAVLALGCATEGVSGDAGLYYGYEYWDDPWYVRGCCVDPPDTIGPPRPAHPIAGVPPSRPSNPTADTLPSTPTATPRAAAARGGGGSFGGGGGRGGGGRR